MKVNAYNLEQNDEVLQKWCPGFHEIFGEFGFYLAFYKIFQYGKPVFWLRPRSSNHYYYPNQLAQLGLKPDQMRFIHYSNEKNAFWICEEILRQKAINMVILEGVKQADLLQSRRLNLAAKKHKNRAILLLRGQHEKNNSAMSRWQVSLNEPFENQFITRLLRSREKGFISGKERWIMDIKNEKFSFNLAPASGAQSAPQAFGANLA